ncbi:DUF3667 domain-containing protein [Chitinophagaceae bacterium 26-R-25]|nr:DUF3667 domain-containing protein [Chitinophagaceae bacterium 26-R-25]
MSHFHQRKEKNCLNCETEVIGRYCHVCGQENIEPKESFGHLLMHFFNDITHFDGKFFSSVVMLFKKPGFLAKEYMKGRRASYLNPIRMYVFTSAIFFFLFFAFFKPGIHPNKERTKEAKEVAGKGDTMDAEDSIAIAKSEALRKNIPITVDSANKISISGDGQEFTDKAEYDRYQESLPKEKRDGFLKKQYVHRMIWLHKKYDRPEGGGGNELIHDLLERFFHSLPYMLFVSLPLYALFLKLLYARNKQFYFADHGIFLIYLYIFTFIFLLVFFTLSRISGFAHFSWLSYILILMFLGGVYYAYRAMRIFYEQGRRKTIAKFLIFNILTSISLLVLFTIFFIFSVYVI